jgi:hypothetical protein
MIELKVLRMIAVGESGVGLLVGGRSVASGA